MVLGSASPLRSLFKVVAHGVPQVDPPAGSGELWSPFRSSADLRMLDVGDVDGVVTQVSVDLGEVVDVDLDPPTWST